MKTLEHGNGKVVITLEGGCLTSVKSDIGIEVEVWDWDNIEAEFPCGTIDEFDEARDTKQAEYNELVKGMKTVW